jgi:hypothetical protein
LLHKEQNSVIGGKGAAHQLQKNQRAERGKRKKQKRGQGEEGGGGKERERKRGKKKNHTPKEPPQNPKPKTHERKEY